MEANINTLTQALELTCKAHKNNSFQYYSDCGQFGIMDASTPLMTDVKTICKAFFGSVSMVDINHSFDIVTIYLDEADFLPEVDIEKLDMALPCGWVEQIREE